MFKDKNKKEEVKKSYRDISNRTLGFGIVTYLLFLILISISILVQSCDLESINPQLVDLQTKQQEEIEKAINGISNNEGEEEQVEDNLPGATQDPSNPLFTLMDTSNIKGLVDLESDYEDLKAVIYTLGAEGDMKLSFIVVLDKKGIRVKIGEDSLSCFIEINKNEAYIKKGEYENFSIKINGNHLYLFNSKGAFVFTS